MIQKPKFLSWVESTELVEVLRTRPRGSITAEAARYLFDLAGALQPDLYLEVGLGQASSMMAVLQATAPFGRAICVEADPECPGLETLERAGLRGRVDIRLQLSHLALPKLVEEGVRVHLAFVDGLHLFDQALVDMFLCDLMLEVGGIMVCDDADWRSIAKAVAFFLANRSYELVPGTPERLAALRKLAPDRRGYHGRVRLNSRERIDTTFRDF